MKKLLCAALVVAIAATSCFGAGDGISRNNPGNIVKTGVLWEGQVKGKGRFAHFKDAHSGLRALGIVLIRYQQYHNIKTVEKLVARFAPAHENDVSSYENFVARHLGLYTKSPLWITHNLPDIMEAIIHFENGRQPYSREDIVRASEAALDYCGVKGYWRVALN